MTTRATKDKEEIDRRLSIYTQNDVSKRAAERRQQGVVETVQSASAALRNAEIAADYGQKSTGRYHLIDLAAIVCRLIEEHEGFSEQRNPVAGT